MNTDINNAVQTYFEKLDIDPIDFVYDRLKNRFISKDSFKFSIDDYSDYFIVIKVTNTVGTVILGMSDGVKFSPLELLGQIWFDGSTWIAV